MVYILLAPHFSTPYYVVKREEIMMAKVTYNALKTLLGVMVLKGRMKTQLGDQHKGLIF